MDFTAPYTPEQNGVSERGNRTTTEKARTLLKQARLPSEFWGEAVSTAVSFENLTPIAKAGFKSPHELWHGDAPSYEHLRVFGCLAYVFIRKESRDGKFSDVAKKGILVGYQGTMKNYRIFLLEEKKVVITHDVRFEENIFPYNDKLELNEEGFDEGPAQTEETSAVIGQNEVEETDHSSNDDSSIVDAAVEPDSTVETRAENAPTDQINSKQIESEDEDQEFHSMDLTTDQVHDRLRPTFEYVP